MQTPKPDCSLLGVIRRAAIRAEAAELSRIDAEAWKERDADGLSHYLAHVAAAARALGDLNLETLSGKFHNPERVTDEDILYLGGGDPE